MNKFRMPENMRDPATKKFPDTFVVEGHVCKVDPETGMFDAPVEINRIEGLHMGIKGAAGAAGLSAPPPAVNKPKAIEEGGEDDKDNKPKLSEADLNTLDAKLKAGTATVEEVTTFVETLSYVELAERLVAARVEPIPNKKDERRVLLVENMMRGIKKE